MEWLTLPITQPAMALGTLSHGGSQAVQEECRICGKEVPYSVTVHVLVHTNTDEGVVDYYVCRGCYEEQVAPLFAVSAEGQD